MREINAAAAMTAATPAAAENCRERQWVEMRAQTKAFAIGIAPVFIHSAIFSDVALVLALPRGRHAHCLYATRNLEPSALSARRPAKR